VLEGDDSLSTLFPITTPIHFEYPLKSANHFFLLLWLNYLKILRKRGRSNEALNISVEVADVGVGVGEAGYSGDGGEGGEVRFEGCGGFDLSGEG